MNIQTITTNKRSRFDYEITQTVEAGVALKGCEVKSIRSGHVTMRDSFARVVNGEMFLLNCRIEPFKQQSTHETVEVGRTLKLLLHSKETVRWQIKVESKNFVIVPIKLYFKGNRVKVELGLGVPKKLHDKRDSIKQKMIKRDLDRARKGFI